MHARGKGFESPKLYPFSCTRSIDKLQSSDNHAGLSRARVHVDKGRRREVPATRQVRLARLTMAPNPQLAFFSQHQELGDHPRELRHGSCMLPAFAGSLATVSLSCAIEQAQAVVGLPGSESP